MKIGKDCEDPSADEHQGFIRLMSQIMLHAYHDFWHADDLEIALDGLLWLASEDAWLYTEALKIESDPLRPIVEGTVMKKRSLKEKL